MSLFNEIDIYSRLMKLDDKASSFDTKLLLAEDAEGGDNADDEDSEPQLKKRARNEVIFWCHRGLLSAHSGYFKGMFSSGMTESTSKTLSMSIPKGTLVVFHYVVEFVYNGFIKKPSLDELVRLCILSDYLQLENFKELIAGSIDCKSNFIELSHLASLHRYEFIGTQLLLNHSPLGCLLNVTQVNDVILLEKAKEAEDAMDEWMDNSRGTGYDEVGALFDLLWLFDESVLPTVVAIIAKTASIQWRSLKQLARLPLTVFVRLLLAIPFGDISENVFSEIILSYIDRRGLGTSELFLTGADSQFLLGLIDTSVVTPDYLQYRLLDRLPAEKQAFLVETLPAFESLSYQFRCPLTLQHLATTEGHIKVLPCGHYVSDNAWVVLSKIRLSKLSVIFNNPPNVSMTCPIVGCHTQCTISKVISSASPSAAQKHAGSSLKKRLEQHKKTKERKFIATARQLLSMSPITEETSSFPPHHPGAAVVSALANESSSPLPSDLSTPTFLEVIFMGVEEDEPLLFPLTWCRQLTVGEVVIEAASKRRLSRADFWTPYIPCHLAGGRLPPTMTVDEYIHTYFKSMKVSCITLYVSCLALPGKDKMHPS